MYLGAESYEHKERGKEAGWAGESIPRNVANAIVRGGRFSFVVLFASCDFTLCLVLDERVLPRAILQGVTESDGSAVLPHQTG